MMRSSLLAAAAVLFAAGAVQAQDHGGRGFLSPEQRAMMVQDQGGHADWHSMTQEQRAQHRDEMRAKWASMSDADKQALKVKLQAEFDALSPAQKQAVEQKIAERRAQWQQHQGQDQ